MHKEPKIGTLITLKEFMQFSGLSSTSISVYCAHGVIERVYPKDADGARYVWNGKKKGVRTGHKKSSSGETYKCESCGGGPDECMKAKVEELICDFLVKLGEMTKCSKEKTEE